MKLKIMGLGEVPRLPPQPVATPKGCGNLLVKWDLSGDAGAFPVHRVLLQRRVGAHDGELYSYPNPTSNPNPNRDPTPNLGVSHHGARRALDSAWITVFAGLESAFLDTGNPNPNPNPNHDPNHDP